jgi:transcriptional regulator with XRE-family HTH domain
MEHPGDDENDQVPAEPFPLAALLQRARQRAGLTAREVARRAGVDVGTVTRIELGQIARPTPDSVTAIGAVLGVSAADLFAAADWLPREELPTLRPYLRAKYRELPDEAVAEVEALLNRYTERYGGGPADGEDEH